MDSIVKNCATCVQEKPLTAFKAYDAKNHPGVVVASCNACVGLKRAAARRPVVYGPETTRRYNVKGAQSAKRAFLEGLKKSASCSHCGLADERVMDFHHIDPSTKTAALGRMVMSKATLEDVIDEATKCIPLCANCHRIHHWEMRKE